MMNGRRIPLASVPNAANSPIRPNSNILTKRSRPVGDDNTKDALYALPPQKKYAADPTQVEQDPRYATYHAGTNGNTNNSNRLEYQGLSQHLANGSRTATARRPEPVRDSTLVSSRPVAARAATEKNTHDSSLEDIRQWQRHYKKAFQEYVFYFENLPDEPRLKLSRQVRHLGSKEEKFFSKSVTHIVTTRPIPPPIDQPAVSNPQTSSLQNHPSTSQAASQRYQTINPTLLESAAAKARLGGEHPHAHATNSLSHDEARRPPGSTSGDILLKAREMKIKIWALEKIQRMMVTMYDTDTGEQPIMRLDRDGVSALDGRPSRPADLSQLLEKEKIPIVRDPNDMTFFKGFFVYVHDQDEKTRPIIVRDYPKPPTKEEGQWPQFRLTGPGRCPFVEDYYDRRMYRAAQESRNAASRQTTATTTASTATTAPAPATANTGAGTNASTHEATITPISSVSTTAAPTTNSQSIIQPTTKKRPAEDLNPPPSQRLRRSARVQTASAAQVQTTQPNYTPSFHLTHTGGGSVGSPAPTPEPSGVPAISSRQSSGEGFPAANPARPAPPRPPARLICGEPVASGIQPSNITSAIRSQMVSSAAGIGARAGTSREVHQLQRKVLAQTTSASAGTGPSSFVNEARAAVAQAPQQPQPRAAKLKAQESLCQKQRATATQARKQSTKKKAEAEGKAGYCENCQDKFTDFKVHVLTRKHRHFALVADNWKELDSLLSILQRQPCPR